MEAHVPHPQPLILSILTPIPSPFQGEGWPTGRGEVVNEGCLISRAIFYINLSFGGYDP